MKNKITNHITRPDEKMNWRAISSLSSFEGYNNKQ